MTIPDQSNHPPAAGETQELDNTLDVQPINLPGTLPPSRVEQYMDRLSTYTITTYFAKPPCLSPLVCSRFGWRNVSRDMLQCDQCSSALAISYPSGLPFSSMQRIASTYRAKIAIAHKQDCPFRLEASQFLRHDNVDSPPVVPSALLAVMDDDMVKFLLHMNPLELLCERANKLASLCSSSTYQYPPLDGLKTLQADLGDGVRQTPAQVLSGLSLEGQDESTMWLALLGWQPAPSTSSSDDTAVLYCPLCLARMQVNLAYTDDTTPTEESDAPQAKRQKTGSGTSPVDGHRHYCSFKCGFPVSLEASTPLWQILLSRLNNNKIVDLEEEDEDEDFAKIRAILRSGVAPRVMAGPTDD